MKPDRYKALLKDLQKLQKKLVPAYVKAVRASATVQATMATRHAAAEVGGSRDDFVKLCARRSSVQLLLRTVFVRVLEDLGALDEPRIRGDRGLAVFREVAPGLGVRGHLAWTFRDLAVDFPALFTPGPDELPLPDESLCRAVWELWHRKDGTELVYAWTDGDFDSRFLGDLYQDLDADIRKRYALLQTPEFVESYILDHTLTPALQEFDPVALRERGECFRVLDPTCGSGHFLIGAFRRMADFWEEQGCSVEEACERALESVWGCDLNPHAVAIASFRLLLETRERAGGGAWSQQPRLAVLDSLVPWEREGLTQGYGVAEDRAVGARFLEHEFHAVVGNPPYIVPKDRKKRKDYAAFWPKSCFMNYAMSAPFVERIITLPVQGGFAGQITANSFMKRQFGSRLVSTVLPSLDLTGVVDTSGAYIPGHGTPTVVLFARNQAPQGQHVWSVLGKRGEPSRPDVPADGRVWSAIRAAGQREDDGSVFVTVRQVPRSSFAAHPWSLDGGAAPGLFSAVSGAAHRELDAMLTTRIGFACITGEDAIYADTADAVVRDRAPLGMRWAFVQGDQVRDYGVAEGLTLMLPMRRDLSEVSSLDQLGGFGRRAWRAKQALRRRVVSGSTAMEAAGKAWYELRRLSLEKFVVPATITFAFVSTHNHFVLDRGGKVFKRSAPVIKLPPTATEEDHLDLLGLLNSSTLGFWMKQVFHCKGASSGDAIRSEDWEPFWEYDSTKLKKAPLVDTDRDTRVELARDLDFVATQRATCLPDAVLDRAWEPHTLADLLAAARTRYREHTEHMVSLQEELDWLTYHSYGLLDTDLTVPVDQVEPLAPGHRPFEVVFARQDDQAPPDEKSAWWSRHGHDRVTQLPDRYSPDHRARMQQRIDVIESNKQIAFLEQAAYKRRWQTPDLNDLATKAVESWLLDSLEDLFAPASDDTAEGPLADPRPYRLEQVVDAWRSPRVEAVLRIWRRRDEVDLTLAAEELLRGAGLPDNPYRLYAPEGIRKLDQWKDVWHLQDLEDAGQPLVHPTTGETLDEIPLPPKFTRSDFQKADYYKVRGKLNVPRERFILFDELAPNHFGWNGWRDQERALAQTHAYEVAEHDTQMALPAPTADDPRRCGPTLGLWESLPDLKRWGEAEVHGELEALAQEVCQQTRCPCALVEKWQQWTRGELEITLPQVSPEDITVDQRAFVSDQLVLSSLTFDELRARWSGNEQTLQAVLDDLVASGDVQTSGRGRTKRFQRVRG